MESEKNNRKEYIIGVGFEKHMDTEGILVLNNTQYRFPHTVHDISFIENTYDVTPDGVDIILRGVSLPKEVVTNIIHIGKTINSELYSHKWEKFAEIDQCNTIEEINSITWDYDMSKVWSV